MKKSTFCLISLSSLLAVAATLTGCRSTSSDYSRGYEAGHYAASAPSQPSVAVQSQTSQTTTNYKWLGYVPVGSEPQAEPGTTYIWQGYAKPVAVEAQGAPPTVYYSEQGQGQGQPERRATVSRHPETEINTTIMPYSAYRGTDEHWYDTPGWVEPRANE